MAFPELVLHPTALVIGDGGRTADIHRANLMLRVVHGRIAVRSETERSCRGKGSDGDHREVLGDARGDGGGSPAAGIARPLLQTAHSLEQVPPRHLLLALEVRGPAPRLREVRVRPLPAPHEEDAGDSPTTTARHQHHPRYSVAATLVRDLRWWI